jgi:hypothetical protein
MALSSAISLGSVMGRTGSASSMLYSDAVRLQTRVRPVQCQRDRAVPALP